MTNAEYEVGQILYTSWGYDQTNVSFYKVVNKTGKATLALQEVGQQSVELACFGSMAAKVVADTDKSLGSPFKVRVGKYGPKISNYEPLYKWDGNPKYVSWYA